MLSNDAVTTRLRSGLNTALITVALQHGDFLASLCVHTRAAIVHLQKAASNFGRYLVSGASDQTVRLWNLRTYELLVTLFNAADGEWAIWTR